VVEGEKMKRGMRDKIKRKRNIIGGGGRRRIK